MGAWKKQMGQIVTALLVLLFQAFMITNALGSPSSQIKAEPSFDGPSDKSLFSVSGLADNLLVQIPHKSEHLSLYDQSSRKLRDGNETAQLILEKGLKQEIAEELMQLRIRSVVTSHASYHDDIFSVSKEYNIDPFLLHAIAEIESRYNPTAISPAGAKGLMQIMPDTARRFGMRNPDTELFDPRNNLRICSNYLRTLHGIFGNNLSLILAAYNAGENAVIKYGYTIPPYHETQQYVTKVMNRYLELKNQSVTF
jgi:hypothetical protein